MYRHLRDSPDVRQGRSRDPDYSVGTPRTMTRKLVIYGAGNGPAMRRGKGRNR